MSLLLALLFAAPPALHVESTVPMEPVRGHAQLLASGIPDAPAELRRRVLRYLHARSASLLDVLPDGSGLLIATRFGGTRQMHFVDHPRGDRYQLSFGDEPIGWARFVPGQPERILFLQDTGGGEAFQINAFDRKTGRSELLTDGKSRHEAVRFSRDGKLVAFDSTARNGKDADIYLAAPGELKSARRLVEAGGTWHPLDFSPDGRSLVAELHRSITDSELWLIDLQSGARRRLTPEGEQGSVHGATFAADGKALFYATDRGAQVNQLHRLDLGSLRSQPLTAGLPWNVEHFAVARDGSRVALTINADGYSKLFLYDCATGGLEPRALPEGVASALRFPTGRSDRLFLELQSARSSPDVWHLELKSGELVRWTRSEAGGLDLEAFAVPELVRYPSTDGVQVPAFLYRPRLAEGQAKAPVVVLWHGGPEGQSRPVFAPFVQMLVSELGAAVLLPNVRGSDGYGKAYLSMDDGIKREEALHDLGATFDYIASRPDLDANQVAVYGGSYGGYLALASVAFYPKRVRAGVDVVGISSLPSFLSTTQGYRRDLRRAEYGDERISAVRAVQERISPLSKVDRIEAALFVQQGRNDPRVPQSEAEQLVRALRANKREVWYLLALDEGHGFKKKANADFAAVATVMFLQQKLLRR